MFTESEIIKQIGRTLTTAHAADIIHRDLKPANIMIRRNASGDWQVKVLDFGIAKVKGSALPMTPTTAFQVGTPLYLSPEQRNLQEVTPASDVYARGIIAYEMLTGPFDQDELPEIIQSGVKAKPSALRPELPKAVDGVILKALSTAANKRYQSAREFGEDLAQALALTRKLKWWRVAAVILAALIIGVITWQQFSTKPSDTATASPAELKAAPERSLNFSLRLKTSGRDPTGRPVLPRDIIFKTDDEVRLTLSSSQAGYLYLISEGREQANPSPIFVALFPNAKDNRGSARINANQKAAESGRANLITAFGAQPNAST